MPGYEDVIQGAGSLQALTGLTETEFQALLPHFEQAFVAYMHDRTIDGQPRTSRRYSTYGTCPLPTIADKRLFILTYLKQNPIARGARTALWDVAVKCEHMDSLTPSRVESGVSGSRAASGSYGRRLGRDARDATNRRFLDSPPFLA